MKLNRRPVMAIAALALTLGATAPAFSAPEAFKTTQQKVSYTFGFELGKNFRMQDITIDEAILKQGLQDGYNGKTSAMTEAQMKATIQAFQKELMEKAMKARAQAADTNLKNSTAFIAKIAQEKGVKKLEDGLYYKVIKTGKGPFPTAHDKVTVNYEGKLPDGKVFDSSYKRKAPATLRVDQVIPGWTEALKKMQVGSTWMLYISPKLAYGEFAPPQIGPNQALTFKIDLIGIAKDEPKS